MFTSVASERSGAPGCEIARANKQPDYPFFLRAESLEYDNEEQGERLETACTERRAYSHSTQARFAVGSRPRQADGSGRTRVLCGSHQTVV